MIVDRLTNRLLFGKEAGDSRRMHWGPILLCGWPGLARLWYRGSWTGLIVALGFSLLLNTALIVSFVWPWFFGETFPLLAWPLIFLIWTVSARLSYQNLPDLMSVHDEPLESEVTDDLSATLFNQAQSEYLKGHWKEAEILLNRRLAKQPRDIESRLLLATTFRHILRLDEARVQLETIERFDESIRWRFEILRERELIDLEERYGELESADEAPLLSEPKARAG